MRTGSAFDSFLAGRSTDAGRVVAIGFALDTKSLKWHRLKSVSDPTANPKSEKESQTSSHSRAGFSRMKWA